jgi:hypothetical protein
MSESDANQLSPEVAGEITRLMLEIQAINRKRQLVDALRALGVTPHTFNVWSRLNFSQGLGVNAPLQVSIANLLSSVSRGTDVKVDALVQIKQKTIADHVKKTVLAQAQALSSVETENPPINTPTMS